MRRRSSRAPGCRGAWRRPTPRTAGRNHRTTTVYIQPSGCICYYGPARPRQQDSVWTGPTRLSRASALGVPIDEGSRYPGWRVAAGAGVGSCLLVCGPAFASLSMLTPFCAGSLGAPPRLCSWVVHRRDRLLQHRPACSGDRVAGVPLLILLVPASTDSRVLGSTRWLRRKLSALFREGLTAFGACNRVRLQGL